MVVVCVMMAPALCGLVVLVVLVVLVGWWGWCVGGVLRVVHCCLAWVGVGVMVSMYV